MDRERDLQLSVVVPFYNEEESAEKMYSRLVEALDPTGLTYELIFVDDGSRDETFAVLNRLAGTDSRLRVIKFRGNFGQTPAMAAGIDTAAGDVIVTLDGDLQNDPSDIPNLMQGIEEGYDMVVGWRHNRQDALLRRKVPSVIANWIIGKVTGVPIRDNGCSLKAFRASVIKQVPLYSEMHRFIPAMASVAGTRVKEIRVTHHARQFGESKYGLSRIYRVLLDLMMVKTLVTFMERPLPWFLGLSMPTALLGVAAVSVALSKFLDSGIMPIALISTGILLVFTSAFALLVGVLGELVFKTGDVRPTTFSLLTSKTHAWNAKISS